jgi:hypothetical protein
MISSGSIFEKHCWRRRMLRLLSTTFLWFHSCHDDAIDSLNYLSGETVKWNVPYAEELFVLSD